MKSLKNKQLGFKVCCLTMLMLVLMVTFFGCSSQKIEDLQFETSEQKIVFFAVKSITYTNIENVKTAYINVLIAENNDTENVIKTTVGIKKVQNANDVWFSVNKTNYVFDGNSLKMAMKNWILLSDDEELKNCNDNVKISFKYSTDYKSVGTNGVLSKSQDVFHYSWLYSLGDSVDVEIWKKTEIRATWYAVLISVAIAFAIVFILLSKVIFAGQNSNCTNDCENCESACKNAKK